jgi:hypothetical protein
MREKDEMRDGSLGVGSSSGTGAMVELRVPLDGQLQGPSEGRS